jgi:hypothetical protein
MGVSDIPSSFFCIIFVKLNLSVADFDSGQTVTAGNGILKIGLSSLAKFTMTGLSSHFW